LKPHVETSAGKLKLLKGIANSAVQLAWVRRVRTIHIESQSLLVWPLAKIRPSTRAPTGLVEK
jgi:hypothetical protein